MSFRILVAVLLLAAAAVAQQSPVGVWEWVETEVSAGVFTTPADVGHAVEYELVEGGLFREYHDEMLVVAGTWENFLTEYQGEPIQGLSITREGETLTYAYGTAPQESLTLYAGHNAGGWPSLPVEYYESRGPVAAEPATWSEVKLLFH